MSKSVICPMPLYLLVGGKCKGLYSSSYLFVFFILKCIAIFFLFLAGVHGHITDPMELDTADHQLHSSSPERERCLQSGKGRTDSVVVSIEMSQI